MVYVWERLQLPCGGFVSWAQPSVPEKWEPAAAVLGLAESISLCRELWEWCAVS